jgi:anti-sigma factor RsiW
MTVHEKVTELLALSAAGLLSPDQERTVKSHLSECAECAARASEFARLSSALSRLPAPPTPPFLAARTEARLAAAAERSDNTGLAALSAVIAWALTFANYYLYRTLSGDHRLVSLAWFVVAPLLLIPVAAAVRRSRRAEERSL